MRYLLDTVTFIWASTSPEKLSRKVTSLLENANDLREISVISLSEIALKNVIGTLAFDKADVSDRHR